ncbi:MAG: glycosyltransferase family 9 protein [Selenomonadaceae bacterium]|nr:glycosyltransferase family 9 protein [Selenomonadaceae bacterium]
MDLSGKQILITNCCGLGDLIMFTPALRSLKEKFPSCHITFVCRDNYRDALIGLPYVDEVACIYRGKPFGRYRTVPALINKDIVVFTDWQVILMIFSKLLRIPFVAGYRRENHILSKCLKKELTEHPLLSKDYVACTNARIISNALEIKIKGDMTKIDISEPQTKDVQSVDKMLKSIGLKPDSQYILMTPFTGFEQRNLPIHNAIEFVKMVEKIYDLPVVISAPKKKWEIAKEISKYTLINETSIREFVELVKRSEILVTPDSGPMHVAGAVEKKCVAIFGKDLPSRWAPKRNCIPLYLNPPCSPCDDDTARKCSLSCINNITADMIFEACEQIIKNKN